MGCCLVGMPAMAAESVLPTLMQQVQSEYQKVAGIQAQFSQITEIKSTHQVKKAKGRIWIKRPNKLRWETLEPDPNILVSDGKVFWFYTPPFEESDRGQVIIRKRAQVQTQFLNALLSGSFDFGKGKVAIEEKSKSTFLLRPKQGTAGDVSSAEIEIDPAKRTITQVNLVHISGNQTRVQLEGVALTSKLDDSLFRFKIDNNTDKIVE
jgi:outer membrane lipoprotein carrier protein